MRRVEGYEQDKCSRTIASSVEYIVDTPAFAFDTHAERSTDLPGTSQVMPLLPTVGSKTSYESAITPHSAILLRCSPYLMDTIEKAVVKLQHTSDQLEAQIRAVQVQIAQQDR